MSYSPFAFRMDDKVNRKITKSKSGPNEWQNGEMPKVIASHWLARLKVIRHYFNLFMPTSHRFQLHTFDELQFHSIILNLLLLRMHPDDSA